ncbi:E3 ubiquitin-protein ligase makorin-1-like [Actinia tenebrosa]|uniref:RING-type E3 ubiquitin transferase n=1 Tax=Actinia tenebrosa TaxID=6105 RepID=A0A6P8HDZ4_ACTTE|nr:E3 ubiquitin-protein ligase makorin-1-like [Actinia tenebrosa]
MEYSFAVQRSEGVACGICLEVVKSKLGKSEQRFGILPYCSHAFCLSCIRKWRNSSHTENKIVRTCPLCRVFSGFVIPSSIWVEDPEEKQNLITEYTKALSNKPCKYFNEGKGTCPFGSSCFYHHAYPDGSKEEFKLRRLNTADGGVKTSSNCRLWDFVEARENQRTSVEEDVVWENERFVEYD